MADTCTSPSRTDLVNTLEETLLCKHRGVSADNLLGRLRYDLPPPHVTTRLLQQVELRNIFAKNRLVVVTVSGPVALHPYHIIPVASTSTADALFYRLTCPGSVLGHIHIECYGAGTEGSISIQESSTALVPLHMLYPYFSVLYARQATSYQSCLRDGYRLPSPKRDTGGRTQYCFYIHTFRTTQRVRSEVKRGLLAAFSVFNSNENYFFVDVDYSPVSVQDLEQVSCCSLDFQAWTRYSQEQLERCSSRAANILVKRGREVLSDDRPMLGAFGALAAASQLLLQSSAACLWDFLDKHVRQRLCTQAVASTYNAMVLACGHASLREGWSSLVTGECGVRLCICAVRAELRLPLSDTSLGRHTSTSYELLGSVPLTVWLAVRHLAVLNHFLPKRGQRLVEVARVMYCILHLQEIRAAYLQAHLVPDTYLEHDIVVMKKVANDMTHWTYHSTGQSEALIPQAGGHDPIALQFFSTELWSRLSVGGEKDGFPLRILQSCGNMLWLEPILQGTGLTEADFSY